MAFRNRKYKDSVFTDLFGSDRDGKKNFLTFNNDVSWEIDGKLIVLVEHQSTINENMPFRCLEYVTRIYEEIAPIPKCCRLAETVIF